MSRVGSGLVKVAQLPLQALLWTAARLPLPVAHTFADILAFTAHTVVRYRRRIVYQNLKDCFPEMDPRQLRTTEKQFYRYLADYFFETLALSALSNTQITKRIEFTNTSLLADLFASGRDVVLYTAHYGNWEYLTALPLTMKGLNPRPIIYSHVYRRLKNRFFNNYFLQLRSRFNRSVEMKSVLRTIVEWRKNHQQFIMGFLSDQKPGSHTRPVTVDFLGRPTPFIEGTEELARKLGCAVIYADMERTSRSHYRIEFRLMSHDASKEPSGALTARYAALLTATIRRNPPFYLWSHNRWRIH